jgi:NAD(P)-dependent dehydrogenase (short-subunit alcohol dehydrogenase family)
MDLGLTGKTVLMVGGNSNIGRATSLAFAKEGANVAIAARDFDACQEVASLANTLGGGSAIAIKADATKFEEAEAAVQTTIQAFSQIDVLVHGTAWDITGSFVDLDRKEWDKIIAVNFTSVLTYFKLILPLMIARRSGNIVTMGSVMGRRGDPLEPVYGGCKAGVVIFSQAIARDVGRFGIRVATCNSTRSKRGLGGQIERQKGQEDESENSEKDDICKFGGLNGGSACVGRLRSWGYHGVEFNCTYDSSNAGYDGRDNARYDGRDNARYDGRDNARYDGRGTNKRPRNWSGGRTIGSPVGSLYTHGGCL